MKLPRFTLRELFLLVVIAALACGWWVRERQMSDDSEHSRLFQQRQYDDILKALKEAGITVYFTQDGDIRIATRP